MLKYNKNIQRFIKDNNIKVEYFESNDDAIMCNKYDINQIVAKWGMYEGEEKFNVSISNIIGMSIGDTKSILQELNELFDEEKGSYQNRSVSMLKYDRDNILDGLKESFWKEPIILSEIEKEKYIIGNNGMHRCCLLRIHYLNEMLECKSKRQKDEAKKKYYLPALREKIDRTKTYANYLLHVTNVVNSFEQELDDTYHRTGRIILSEQNDKKYRLNDSQLVEYLRRKLSNIPQEYKTTIIPQLYNMDEYFKDFINHNLKGTEIEKNILKN